MGNIAVALTRYMQVLEGLVEESRLQSMRNFLLAWLRIIGIYRNAANAKNLRSLVNTYIEVSNSKEKDDGIDISPIVKVVRNLRDERNTLLNELFVCCNLMGASLNEQNDEVLKMLQFTVGGLNALLEVLQKERSYVFAYVDDMIEFFTFDQYYFMMAAALRRHNISAAKLIIFDKKIEANTLALEGPEAIRLCNEFLDQKSSIFYFNFLLPEDEENREGVRAIQTVAPLKDVHHEGYGRVQDLTALITHRNDEREAWNRERLIVLQTLLNNLQAGLNKHKLGFFSSASDTAINLSLSQLGKHISNILIIHGAFREGVNKGMIKIGNDSSYFNLFCHSHLLSEFGKLPLMLEANYNVVCNNNNVFKNMFEQLFAKNYMLETPNASPEDIKEEVLKNIKIQFSDPKFLEPKPPAAVNGGPQQIIRL